MAPDLGAENAGLPGASTGVESDPGYPLAGRCVVVGIPFDENSSFLRGPAGAPARIREALHCGSANLSTELGVDLSAHDGWQDIGDLRLPEGPGAMGEIEREVDALLRRGARVLSLGGDHSISYPLLRAHARHYPDLTILHLDAHPDLYDELDGSRISHACPFARIMEEGLCRRLVQVGIRTLNPHQRAQAARFGVEIHEARSWHSAAPLNLSGPLYLSLDMDVLDPAFAPGVSHYEPGGFSVRDVLHILHAIGAGTGAPIAGADLVEFNPTRDPGGVTAMVGAKFYKEILGRMLG